jgi:hypothetical protein
MIVRAEHAERTAAALAVLLEASAIGGPGGSWIIGAMLRVLPAVTSGEGVERLLLSIARPVEDVIEIACMHGFHAEELGRTGLVEFWIGENMLVELVTSDAPRRALLAA